MADEVPESSKIRLDKGEAAGEGAAGSGVPAAPVAPPSVHDQRTVAAVPGPAAPADAPPQGWANAFAAPSGTVPAPPVNPFAAPGPNAPPNPYAPPAAQQPQSAAVPPPPIAPNGPGPVPYGYPGPYPGQALPSYPVGPGGYGGYGGWPGMQPMPNNGLGTAAMVTGIISAIGFCLAPVAFVMGVLAIVFGSIGRRRVRRGEATNGGQALAGIICGSAGLVLVVAFVTLIVVAGSRGSQ
ncbi:DUF4190 domain-containing protein [Streptomyces sp. Ag109_O5-10]|uniref:DUF4190 domain-containing protein n=2 Tax=unclassified Streptomyces TaxID=2593676 RepID=UPI00089ABDBE|nr:DUF4190 domain-containing protein [Streptomyces sp. Ag109_O5-10]SEE47625.1 protein of unknown function [Streptomyces sp. Ag109_O5-10]